MSEIPAVSASPATAAPLRVLLVDDEKNVLRTVEVTLRALGYDVTPCSDGATALERIEATHPPFDLGLFDLKMPGMDGVELVEQVRHRSPTTTCILFTAHGSVETAVEAIRRGAYDFLQKPFNLQEFRHVVDRVAEHHRLRQEVTRLRAQVAEQGGEPAGPPTHNAKMARVLELAEQVADSPLPVLIEGESGTGKERLAEYLVQRSARRGKPFIRVNCAALPEHLLEAELFGHVKGAFTGAVKDREGRFAAADGGTLFLDEIGEVVPSVQVKLLRFLQSQTFERVGESRTRQVDVRIVAATNLDLDAARRSGAFREDLYYRLNTVRLRLPALRERPEDIPSLVRHFLSVYTQRYGVPLPEVSVEAFQLLLRHPWPGNVRELEGVVQRALIVAQGGPIRPAHLPDDLLSTAPHPDPETDAEPFEAPLTLEALERRHIERVLAETPDLEAAARTLGIDPSTLWRKRKRYGLT